jgi:tetratricopeptide (TPR) repeat protein/predicted Ser/Thr protein kinase
MAMMPPPERWQQIAALFAEVLEHPAGERLALLELACAGDPALRTTLERLLDAHERAGGFLEELDTTRAAALVEAVGEEGEPGQVIGRYRVVRQLGRGGMGVVYLAHDERLDRPVALKLLPPYLSTDDAAARRLTEEARAASALDHPHIITIYEIGESADERLYLAMAYYEGETLRERITRGPLSVEEAVELAVQIAEGLAAAHRKGIVHRDIKPENLLITADAVVKILDFGLAKVGGQVLTRPGVTPGTAAYMSPEQTRGVRVDARTDLWSLGVLLYEMLARVRPFRGEDAALVHGIRHDEPAPLRTLRPEVPAGLARVVERCLAKDPSARYPGAEALLVDLLSFADGRGANGPGSPAPLRHLQGLRGNAGWQARVRGAGSWLRHGRGLIAVAAAALVLGVSTQLFDRRPGLMPDPQRVVVAPFGNRTGDPTLDVVGSMAADWIIQGLSHTGLVEVVPIGATLGSARSAAGGIDANNPARLQALARETGAGIVISGSYYLLGDSLHVQGRITDAITGKVLESLAPTSTPRALPLVAVEELRQRVTAGLAPHLDPRMREHARIVSRTPSYDAYREYVLGMERYIGDRDWRRALEHFSRAAEDDPSFALPQVRSAVIYTQTGNYAAADSVVRLLEPRLDQLAEFDRQVIVTVAGLARGDYASSYRAARRAAELAPNTIAQYQLANILLMLNRPREALRVLEQLDPQRGELRGWAHYWIRLAETHHRLSAYEQELEVARRAGEHSPGESSALRLELRALTALGRVTEALQTLEDHLATPDEPTRGDLLQHVARELHAHGHADAARQVFARSVEWWATRPREPSRLLAEAYYRVGRWDEAERVLHEVAERWPDGIHAPGMLGAIAARRGDRAEAERISAWLRALDRPYLLGENTYWCARIAALLGDRDQAVALLRAAFAEGKRGWLDVHYEPDLDSLRDHPRFQELIRPKG